MAPIFSTLLLLLGVFTCLAAAQDLHPSGAGGPSKRWVSIFATMPQLCEPANLPPAPFNDSGSKFYNATLRQTFKVTQTASKLRLQISNAFGGSSLPITAASIAFPANGSAGTSAIDTKSLKTLSFSGQPGYEVPNGALVLSDTIDFPVKAESIVTVSLYFARGQPSESITAHPGSRTTSYITFGNQISTADFVNSSSNTVTRTDHWYFVSGLEAEASVPGASALAIVGDSITDGRGSTTNQNNRWPDILVSRMQKDPATRNIAVLNQAAGGNRILQDGLGPNALGRIDRDVLAQPGVKYAIIFEGVNDIGTAATDAATQQATGTRVIAAYDQMITRLQRFGIKVFGATITPFTGPGQVYGDPEREKTRQRVNKWIRESGRFDGVVDFDQVVRDPNAQDQLDVRYDVGDHLHLNPAGYVAMGEAVDLRLFRP
ncbi:GDSL-like Lipase/Acylhydrolase [Microdochium trichocladiopsis]|uniref:GDSL-like Lipase/Acylhydrolase n=1 Tax=Microdochium trichocladiopsis TaxID=1682393 RepID=A0A9P9BGD4_9PEZI|nr:GDSL-like Lipase/Acylhydrolase [Microdochium trichocladiopsis]KAH7014579.1 GDSL-like Lipase/Acylhydrolase [Microdochium trichocladiopsis]